MLLLLLRYLIFFPEFFGHVGKRIDKKAKVNFKIYDISDWETKITIHILPNISRSKDNQIMKIVRLIEYNLRNTFLKKSRRR